MLIHFLHLLTAAPAIRAADTSTTSTELELTNLSPVLQYEPPPIPGNTDPSAGWVTDEYGTWINTTQNASVSFLWWGGQTLLYGNLSRVVTTIDADYVQSTNEDHKANDWWLTWPQVQYRPSGLAGGANEQAMVERGIAFRTRRPETRYVEWGDRDYVPWQKWDVQLELDQTSTYNRLINVSRVVVGVGLPKRPPTPGVPETNITWLVPAPESVSPSSNVSSAWTAPVDGSWVSIPAPFDSTRYDGRRLQSSFPPVTFDDVQNTSSRVLSTNTSDAPLRIPAPIYPALMVIYGAVGPDQGEFSVALNILGGREERDFHPHNGTRTFTANRQEGSMNEVLAVMWLDPRLQYDVEILNLEEGRNLAIQSVMWVQTPYLGADNKNWWSTWNDQALGRGGSGLSGGQIAGIVVGSIAGAALLLGLAFFFWLLHRKRASAGRESRSEDLSPSQTLTSETATAKPATLA